MNLADFKNKKILIMGLGLHGGGAGAARFFAKAGAKVTVTDLKTKKELTASLAELKKFKKITYHLGGHRASDFKKADLVIKNPGVPKNSKFVKIAERAGVPVLSDIEIFFTLCPAKIIGVTGTKGKSTTASLLYQFLKKDLRNIRVDDRRAIRVWFAGNIRKSVLAILSRIRKNHLVILELSSFQLDSLAKSRLSPEVAVITNIFPDHLNRYSSFRAYAASKAKIFRFQKPGDWLFINSQDPLLRKLALKAPVRVVGVQSQKTLKPFFHALSQRFAPHQLASIALAVAAARYLGVGENVLEKVLDAFRGLPGRLEIVRRVRGVEFVNDTTATNPQAAREAVIFIKKRIGRGNLRVIAGGSDKNLPLNNFVAALKKHASTLVLLPGKAAEKMKLKMGSRAGNRPKVIEVKSMREAVRAAAHTAKKGDAVLLSPGAASFGLFQHEFDRGEKFVQEVKALK